MDCGENSPFRNLHNVDGCRKDLRQKHLYHGAAEVNVKFPLVKSVMYMKGDELFRRDLNSFTRQTLGLFLSSNEIFIGCCGNRDLEVCVHLYCFYNGSYYLKRV